MLSQKATPVSLEHSHTDHVYFPGTVTQATPSFLEPLMELMPRSVRLTGTNTTPLSLEHTLATSPSLELSEPLPSSFDVIFH